ncbi:hypothetical protein DMH15_01065 [Streptomyces sp. WAC 06725]|uniref:PH domain-containing protein n=1 Tax=Streptomyces sp. WAC 06725 TaxID=2203209 RepID=UPI000F748F2B|nr:PH domain-containing protein [Streptomyces sp. WAC 06725]RSO50545.1 hypothetical protein DMH15_01065 [Streptomyces sp. WAC 06725]
MRPVTRHLAHGEELVYVTRQHWTRLVTNFAALVVIWVVAGLLWTVTAGGQGQSPGTDLLVAGAAVLATLWFWLLPVLTWRGTLYLVTTKRIYKRSGFLAKTGHSIPLTRVNDVSFRAALWERVVRKGTLYVQSASEHGLLVLTHVPDPEGLKDVIYRAVDEEQRRAR